MEGVTVTPVERATALIRKAISTDSEAEARTCAFLAVKIIIKEKLELISPATLQKIAIATQEGREAVARERRRPRARTRNERERQPADAPSRTSYESECLFCGERLKKGDKVFWSKVFKVMVCPECFEAEILVKQRMDDLGNQGRRR